MPSTPAQVDLGQLSRPPRRTPRRRSTSARRVSCPPPGRRAGRAAARPRSASSSRASGIRCTNSPTSDARLQRPGERAEPAEVDVDLAQPRDRRPGSAKCSAPPTEIASRALARDRERAHALGRAHGRDRARRGTRNRRASVTPTSDSRVPADSDAAVRAERVVADVDAHRVGARVLERERARQRAGREVVAHRGQQRRAGARAPAAPNSSNTRRMNGGSPVESRYVAAGGDRRAHRRLAPLDERADRGDQHVAGLDEVEDRVLRASRRRARSPVRPATPPAPTAARRAPGQHRPRALGDQPLGDRAAPCSRWRRRRRCARHGAGGYPSAPGTIAPSNMPVNDYRSVKTMQRGPPTPRRAAEKGTLCLKCTGSPSRSAGPRSPSRRARWPSRPPGPSTVTAGDTVVLSTATAGNLRDVDFLPLTVDVEERMYAAGKIPGSFFKREGRAGEKATLIARMIDRPLRPLFPKGWRRETQLVALTLSVDQVHPYDILAMNGASAALMISDIPFPTAVGAVRIGKIERQLRRQPDGRAAADRRHGPRGRRHRRGDPDGRGRRQRGARGRDPRRARHRALGDQEADAPRSASWPRRPASPSMEIEVPKAAEGLIGEIAKSHGEALDEATSVEDKLERQDATKAVEEAVLEQYSGRRRRRHRVRRVPPERAARVRRAREEDHPRAHRRPQEAPGRPLGARDPPDHDRRQAAAAHARLGAVHARPDAGPVASSRSAPRARRCAWTTSGSRRPSATSTTTTSRPSRWARPASCAAPSAATSATARSPSARWSR